jgi:hypothetical protein
LDPKAETGSGRFGRHLFLGGKKQRRSTMDCTSIITAFLTAMVVAPITALITFWGYWRKAEAELQKEYESRFNEKKWEVYRIFANFLGVAVCGSKVGYRSPLVDSFEAEMLISDLILVGSDKVIEAANQFWSCLQVSGDKPTSEIENETRERMMALVSEMREDLGYRSKINITDLWGAFELLSRIPREA